MKILLTLFLVTLLHQSAQAQFNLLDELKKKAVATNALPSLGALTEDQTAKALKEALAKADIRLVGGQDPAKVLAAVQKFGVDNGFPNIEVRELKATPASRTPLDSPFVPIVKEAVSKGFGKPPHVVPSLGGTTPDYVFTRDLGVPSIVVPLAPYDENNHAPNESTKVSLYLAGIRSYMRLIEALGKRSAA